LSERPAEARLVLAFARLGALAFARVVLFAFERLAPARVEEARLVVLRFGFAAARLRPVELDFFEPPELVATSFSSLLGPGLRGLSHVENRAWTGA
jgi:hypothetical protein